VYCKPGDAKCASAVLGSNQSVATAQYAGMNITYSGWAASGPSGGSAEYIRISGITTRKLAIFAKSQAAEASTTQVIYNWKASEDKCCLGLATCEFPPIEREIPQGATQDITVIPAGVEDVVITLVTDDCTDVDIQLYDNETNQAVIAYCEPEATCGYGPLTNMMPGRKQPKGYWPNATALDKDYISYSGYDGDGLNPCVVGGVVQPNKGSEYIKISGVVQRSYRLRFYGYKSGMGRVTYEYKRENIASSITGQP